MDELGLKTMHRLFQCIDYTTIYINTHRHIEQLFIEYNLQ